VRYSLTPVLYGIYDAGIFRDGGRDAKSSGQLCERTLGMPRPAASTSIASLLRNLEEYLISLRHLGLASSSCPHEISRCNLAKQLAILEYTRARAHMFSTWGTRGGFRGPPACYRSRVQFPRHFHSRATHSPRRSRCKPPARVPVIEKCSRNIRPAALINKISLRAVRNANLSTRRDVNYRVTDIPSRGESRGPSPFRDSARSTPHADETVSRSSSGKGPHYSEESLRGEWLLFGREISETAADISG